MILLDTTYVLPLYGLDIKIPDFEEEFEEILLSSEGLSVSAISILGAKGKLSRVLSQNPELVKNYEAGFSAVT